MRERAATGPGATVEVAAQAPRDGEAERLADSALDALLVVMAVWTVVYHVALVLRIGSDPALLAAGVVLVAAGGVALWLRSRRRPAPGALEEPTTYAGGRVDPRWAVATGVLAVVAATGMALSLPWGVVLAGWLGATAAGLVAAGRVALRRPAPAAPPEPEASEASASPPARSRWEAVVVLVLAVGLAALSLVTRKPNADDLYYVNLSQWVAAHGNFPLRDTLYADLRWPMTAWPPIASYDALTGALAHPLGLRAGTLVYEAVPPLMTFAAVFVLWRLLRTWRVPAVAWTLVIALAFLLLDGTSSYATPGNLFVTRLWQGKVILLCVVVPLALVHALRYVQRPDRRGLGRLFITGTAAVGCSTTAMFLMPVVAVAGMAPLLRRPRAALAGFVALAAYPLGAGVASVALGGRSADDFGDRNLFRFDPEWIGHHVFLTAGVAFVAVLAVLLGSVLLPIPAARLTTAVALLAVGVLFVPGVTQAAYDLVGLGPTLWRLTWGCTIAALVGVAAVAAWRAARRRVPLPLVALVAAGACAAYAVTAPPALAPSAGTEFHAPLHWQTNAAAEPVVDWMLDTLPHHSVILGPDQLSITTAVTTTRLKPVAPRAYYLDQLQGQPGFHLRARRLLTKLANEHGQPWPTPPTVRDVQWALRTVDVDAACFGLTRLLGINLVRRAGFLDGPRIGPYQCLVRPGVG